MNSDSASLVASTTSLVAERTASVLFNVSPDGQASLRPSPSFFILNPLFSR